MKYYVYKVFERNGNYEYTHKGTCNSSEFEDNQTPEEWLEETAKNFYSEGDPEEDWYWHFGELITQAYGIEEVTKKEYEILNKYI